MDKKNHDFHLVDPSPWPILTSFSALFLVLGIVNLMHEWFWGSSHTIIGIAFVVTCMGMWWRDVIKEGLFDKAHTDCVRSGLRIGMLLFIFSEIMFFFGFFWSFFSAWLSPMMILENFWPIMEGSWPPEGIKTLDAWSLPFINTLILLLSGTTVTWAHYALINNDMKDVKISLGLTVFLGVIFSMLQMFEYMHTSFAFAEEGIKAVYSSNFYMATGFHGVHVLCGTIFLFICWIRARNNTLTSDSLCFEFAAWYWHFVDVIWLFLFVFVYWLSAS